LLAGLAARTERIRIGVLVSSNTFRHPALLAKQVRRLMAGETIGDGVSTAAHRCAEGQRHGVASRPFEHRRQLHRRLGETTGREHTHLFGGHGRRQPQARNDQRHDVSGARSRGHRGNMPRFRVHRVHGCSRCSEARSPN